ncbi:VRR-NUC domain-containing protein [Rhodothalassium salexigens DSM 2132]|uniref:VRR-NUC domain-containing protein n=1 Tax=Rhodothalassium salexigens DSM 2132 TaxID=1188247 RepID=A0A4R2P5M5_RHOSA|nr:VRR-NUC domain-containing protein [Rhodothalassium salexigens]MBB4212819.1 hypothetical protein [Rhodothalassium salexigens DSM 2132]MBK1638941.1 hypothetical protein [Rhodothalassium salexigens DSM 2132]TCP29508.1 VRR-NUC domain-containing protein [Rhodothalassium salexigens DSM 2132]
MTQRMTAAAFRTRFAAGQGGRRAGRGYTDREGPVHRAIMDYLRGLDAATGGDLLALHVPNGGHMNARYGAAVKAKGAMAGAPDILVLWAAPAGAAGVGWIEVKADRGRLSDSQRRFARRMEHLGVPLAVCRSVADAEAALTDWGVVTAPGEGGEPCAR